MLMGILLALGIENVWPETFICEIEIAEEPLLEIVTLLSASWPTGTFPKLTVPGETRSPPPTGSLTPDPQPDAIIVKEHAKTQRRAFPNPLKRRISAPVRMRNPFSTENSSSQLPIAEGTA
jgi:hypothetical protein